MARQPTFPDPEESGSRRGLMIAVGALVVLVLLWFAYQAMTATSGVKVEAPPPSVISMLPPPPPPPPPPQPKPPEPQEKAAPEPSIEPPKAAAAPAAVSINGPAQAGGDSFGLQAGNGGGIGGGGSTGACTGPNCGGGGTGMSEVFYRRYLSAILQEKVQRDDRVNRLVFSADFAVTISPSGRITSVSILKTSGRDDRDASIKAILLAISNLDPPPSAVRFPQRVTVRGRRSL